MCFTFLLFFILCLYGFLNLFCILQDDIKHTSPLLGNCILKFSSLDWLVSRHILPFHPAFSLFYSSGLDLLLSGFHFLFCYSMFSCKFRWNCILEVNFLVLTFLKNADIILASLLARVYNSRYKRIFSQNLDDTPPLPSNVSIANEVPASLVPRHW